MKHTSDLTVLDSLMHSVICPAQTQIYVSSEMLSNTKINCGCLPSLFNQMLLLLRVVSYTNIFFQISWFSTEIPRFWLVNFQNLKVSRCSEKIVLELPRVPYLHILISKETACHIFRTRKTIGHTQCLIVLLENSCAHTCVH